MTVTKNISVRDSLDVYQFAALVNTVNKFESSVSIAKAEKTVNAKSIMGVLALGIREGHDITIQAEGVDAEDAVEALARVIH